MSPPLLLLLWQGIAHYFCMLCPLGRGHDQHRCPQPFGSTTAHQVAIAIDGEPCRLCGSNQVKWRSPYRGWGESICCIEIRCIAEFCLTEGKRGRRIDHIL